MARKHKATGLAAWIEANICLPQGLSAQPGPVHLWPCSDLRYVIGSMVLLAATAVTWYIASAAAPPWLMWWQVPNRTGAWRP